jgi:hypothetical protein
MGQRKPQGPRIDPTPDLLRDPLIVELAKAGVPQPQIRRILGCDIHRVSRIARHLKRAKPKTE